MQQSKIRNIIHPFPCIGIFPYKYYFCTTMMKIIFALTFALLFNHYSFSQTVDEKPLKKKTKFQAGFYLGSYFSNKHTARLYDGYGYDADGNRNEFVNNFTVEESSFMYRKIVMEYGGGYGQADQIAIALGVDPGQWTFDETDMPAGMRYNPAFMVGAQLSYAVTKKDAVLVNVNAAKLTLSGHFTIVLTSPPIGPQQPGFQNIQTFGISGSEQRLMFQAGYRRLLGDDEIFNFFIEGGPTLNMTEYSGNSIAINNLRIDLGTYYSQPFYTTYRARYLRGASIGAFAGLGMNIQANKNWALQLLYSPSYEKINIGEVPRPTLHHALGLRAIYSL